MLPSLLQDIKWFSQGDASIAAVMYPEIELIAMDFSLFSLKKSLSDLNLSDTTQFRVLILWLFRAKPCMVHIYSVNRVVLLDKKIHFHRTQNWKKLLWTTGYLPAAGSASSSVWGPRTCASQKALLPERIQPWSENQEINNLLPSTALCCGERSLWVLPCLLLFNRSFSGCVLH